jgi:phosphoglycolate phosphatase-like HAD superfamily hydrolase
MGRGNRTHLNESKPVLALFDIDGTILSPGAGARQSLAQAISEQIEQPITFEPGDCAGKTDILIVTNALVKAGFLIQEISEAIDTVIDRYIELLKVNYNAKKDARLYDGVSEMLGKLQSFPNVYLGLLTGNVEVGARIKLEPFGLNPVFPTGAFGDDGFLRTDLSYIAVNRAEAYYRVTFPSKQIIVIGDTAEDVKCGKVINARTMAVSQHFKNEEELRAANPDYIFYGFNDTDAIVDAILSNLE